MKVPLLDRKCPYCAEWFTPLRTNQPCCSSKICYALHKRNYIEQYRAIKCSTSPERKKYTPKRLKDLKCIFCKSIFQSTSSTALCCASETCKKKMALRRIKIAAKWNKKYGRKRMERHLANQKAVSVDGKAAHQSLGKIPRSLRESVMEKWINAVFGLTDQIDLLFSECQHLRGSNSPLLAACLHEGSPSGCWAMHTLNRHRHV